LITIFQKVQLLTN